MKIDRRRLARAIAVAIIGLFLAAGIIYVGRDVAVNPPESQALKEPAPPDTSSPDTIPTTRHRKKKTTKKEARPQRRPAQRDFLNEPVNR